MLKVIGEDVNFFRGGAGPSIFPLEGAGFFNLEGGAREPKPKLREFGYAKDVIYNKQGMN